MLMDSLFCRHCGTKRGEANFEPSYHLASNRGATGALPTSSLPLEDQPTGCAMYGHTAFTAFPRQAVLSVNPFEKAAWQAIPQGIFLRPEGGYGAATNDFSWYPPAGPGDTYSGGTMSYGPPPGVPGVQPCGGYPYGDGAPLYQARMPPVQCYGGLGDCHFDPGFGRGLGGRLAGGLAAPYPGLGPSMFSIPTGSFVADAQMLGDGPSFAGSSAFEDKGAARAARPSVSKSVQVAVLHTVSPDSPTAAMAAGAGSEANAKPRGAVATRSKKKTNRLCC